MAASSQTFTGRLAAAFVESKLTLLLMMAALAFGIWALITTPREENPQITMPAARITAMLPGALPEEVEAKLARPLEAIINQIPGVDHVWSVSADSAAVLIVQYEVGENKEDALVRLAERVAGGRSELPEETLGPWVKSSDVDDVPIFTVSLASERYGSDALRRIAWDVLDRLMGLEDISSVSVMGGRDREITVRIDPAKLESFGLAFTGVEAALRTANLSVPMGSVMTDGREATVRLYGAMEDAQDVRSVIVGMSPAGQAVHLGDVAEITDGYGESLSTASRLGFGPADPRHAADASGGVHELESVTLAAAKRKGANAVVVAGEIAERIERMKGTVIPQGVEAVVTRDDGAKANDAVNTLVEHLVVAVAAVVSVTLLFLGWRAAVIVAVTVPLILAITLGVVGLCGFTINRLTLYALIIALGLLVDDSIVVIENIVRHYGLSKLKGREDRAERAAEAAGEIGSATLLATLTVMAVFLSLLPALTGMPKQYFYPVGFSVPVALAASFLIAYTVAPWAALRWIPQPKQTVSAALGQLPGGKFGRCYSVPARMLVGHPKREVGFVLITFLLTAAVFIMPFGQFVIPGLTAGPVPSWGVEMGFLPKDNKNTFNVTVEMPAGTPVEATDRAVRDVTQEVARIPEVLNWQSWSGLSGIADFNSMMRNTPSAGSEIGAVRVNLTDKNTGRRSSIEIARELRETLSTVSAAWPGSTIQVVEDPPGPPLSGTIYAELYADDPALLREIAGRTEAEFWKTYDIAEVTNTEKADRAEWQLVIDREKAALAGVVPAAAAAELQALVSGRVIGYAHAPGERMPQPIRIEIPDADAFDPSFLSGRTVPGAGGVRVPLSSIVKAELVTAPRRIEKKDGVRMAAVGGELKSTTPVSAVLDLNGRLDGMALPGGGTLVTDNLTWDDKRPDLTRSRAVLLWQGEMRMMLDSYRDLAVSLCLSIGSIFLILVAYYRSFGLALIALSAVPLCFIGLIPGHWLLGVQFSASSLIGVTSLAGIVVRSSLLIIDFVRDYLREGLPLEEAIIDAGAVRLRPILLTTLAIILGSVILITDPVFGGLAVTFIFGTAASTALTIFLVPILLRIYFTRWPMKSDRGGSSAGQAA